MRSFRLSDRVVRTSRDVAEFRLIRSRFGAAVKEVAGKGWLIAHSARAFVDIMTDFGALKTADVTVRPLCVQVANRLQPHEVYSYVFFSMSTTRILSISEKRSSSSFTT